MDAPLGDRAIQLARRVLQAEASAIVRGRELLDERFVEAVHLLLACEGHVVTFGLGKSGHIAGKLAATFASTGTPSVFVHAADAAHGDLGMITERDVVLALSHSGETAEVIQLLDVVRRRGTHLIALTDASESTLARAADVVICPGCDTEADPLGLAPTSSTTAALALGDALAMAAADARGFTAERFGELHPGGSLGEQLRASAADGPPEARP